VAGAGRLFLMDQSGRLTTKVELLAATSTFILDFA
jgi:hypothetical protein